MSWGVDDLEVRYGDLVAVRSVSLAVTPAALTAVVGGDGAGKTTLLRALVGLVRPTRGTVRRPALERVGYLAAGSGVFPDLTVDENLGFAARAYRVAAADLAGRGGDLLERTGLAGARARLGGNLSGGMRRKLGMAMALVHRPDLLVLDEPTTGLDPVSRAELWRLVARAAAEGAAVVFATTYLDEAERAAWVLALDEGRALVTGGPEEVIGAVPGALFEADGPVPEAESWRRGARWRVWSPEGARPPGGRPVRPSLQDAVAVAALAHAAEEASSR